MKGIEGEKSGLGLTVVVVVANDNLFYFSVFAHLAPEIFIEGVKVILQLARVHLVLGIVGGVLIEVREKDGLGVGWFDMFSRAAVTVSTSAYFIIEGAVDLCSVSVLLVGS